MADHQIPGPGNGSVGSTRSRPGRRALFSEFDAAAGDGQEARQIPEGRRALFSELPPEETPAAARRGAVVHCRTCLAATPVSLAALGRSLVPSLWLPTRPWPRLMRCPSCHRLSWCRIDWPRLR